MSPANRIRRSSATNDSKIQGIGSGMVKLVTVGFLKASVREVSQMSVRPWLAVEVALWVVAAAGRWMIVVTECSSSRDFGKKSAPGTAL